jgi:hypothetical protein
VLRWFAHAVPLDPTDAQYMAGWHQGATAGGFSLHAAVRIKGRDRAGLERPRHASLPENAGWPESFYAGLPAR